MYIVSKGRDKVNTPDKESAKAIVNALNDMDSPEATSISSIQGLTDNSQVYTLDFAGYSVNVSGKDSVLKLTLWVLLLNGQSISITRKEDKE